MDCSSSFLPYF